jgi:HEAT repeat protein
MQSDEPLLVKSAIGEAVLRRTRVPVAALCKLADGGAFRTDAIPALAMIGGEDAVNSLRGQLSDDDKLVSALAAYGLAAHGRRDGVRELWHALRNPITGDAFHDRIIRGGAARALVELGEIDTRRELDEVFELARAEGRYLCPRLARSGKPAQLAKLRNLVVDSSADHLVRKWAAIALGDIRDRASAANLKRALADPSRQVREAAQAALQKIGS